MSHFSGLWRAAAIVAAALLSYVVAGLLWPCDGFVQQLMGAVMVMTWLSWAVIGWKLLYKTLKH